MKWVLLFFVRMRRVNIRILLRCCECLKCDFMSDIVKRKFKSGLISVSFWLGWGIVVSGFGFIIFLRIV